jgi:glycerol uptake facilitator-like aquaporin
VRWPGREQISLPNRGKNSRRQTGLHGHPLDANMSRACAAEAVGTFFLVLTIISTAIAATLDKPIAGAVVSSLAVPLAGGLTLAAAVACLGPISGAHLNPAVTIGLAVNRRFPWKSVPAYAAAQFADAIGAALAAWALYEDRARTVASLGATYPASGVGAWRAFGAEAVVTFLLVAVIAAVATNATARAGVAAMATGFALAAAILISGSLTGAGANPARGHRADDRRREVHRLVVLPRRPAPRRGRCGHAVRTCPPSRRAAPQPRRTSQVPDAHHDRKSLLTETRGPN